MMNAIFQFALAALVLTLAANIPAMEQVEGVVVDLNGRPLARAQVSLDTPGTHAGADVITVFTGEDGRFSIPDPVDEFDIAEPAIRARVLGYEQISSSVNRGDNAALDVTLILRHTGNQAPLAPASAWLERIDDRD
jgi:hypothetical protein